jgi:hypothetical protein
MSSGFSHESSKNISVDWYTPEWIFKALGLEFDLDPCSPSGGVPWIPAKRFYTIEDDGLSSERVLGGQVDFSKRARLIGRTVNPSR